MRSRPAACAVAVAVATVVLSAAPACAQVVENPPPIEEIGFNKPWTWPLALGLAALTALVIVGTALGYLLKAREFRANQRRGGAK